MRIAFIVDRFPMLSETFVLNQMTGLLSMGHEVRIFARRKSKTQKVHEDVQRYGLMERVRYIGMPSNPFLRVAKAVCLLVANFHKSPVALLRCLKAFKHGRGTLALRGFYALVPFVREGNAFDIICCHFGPNGLAGLSAKQWGARGKLVTVFHGHDLSAFLETKGEDVYDGLFARGDLFLPVNRRWRDRLLELGFSEDKVLVHHMGIDLERFRFRERRARRGGRVKIVTVARLVEKKGVEYAIRAVASLLSRRPDLDISYSIGGDGPLGPQLKALVSDLGVDEHVRFLGSLDVDEVAELLVASDVFLLPSVTGRQGDQEGTPVALMEALAVGVPVVSTDHSGIPELVVDGESGFLVPERDVEALATKLQYLIQHPEQWPQMGQLGRKLVEESYDIRRLNQRLGEIFAECLATWG
jgi:colanic acid/amylovoran biosynthesis glycosyltransferase